MQAILTSFFLGAMMMLSIGGAAACTLVSSANILFKLTVFSPEPYSELDLTLVREGPDLKGTAHFWSGSRSRQETVALSANLFDRVAAALATGPSRASKYEQKIFVTDIYPEYSISFQCGSTPYQIWTDSQGFSHWKVQDAASEYVVEDENFGEALTPLLVEIGRVRVRLAGEEEQPNPTPRQAK